MQLGKSFIEASRLIFAGASALTAGIAEAKRGTSRTQADVDARTQSSIAISTGVMHRLED